MLYRIKNIGLIVIAVLSVGVNLCAQEYNWKPAGLPLPANHVFDVHYSETSGKLYVAGLFVEQTDTANIWYDLAIYDGLEWEFDNDFDGSVRGIMEYNGSIYATGNFGIHHSEIDRKYKLFGDEDIPNILTEPESSLLNLKVVKDTLFAIGIFEEINGVTANGIAKWTGTEWQGLYPLNTFDFVPQLADIEYYQGEYYITGNFTATDEMPRKLGVFRDGEIQQVGQGVFGDASCGRMLVYDNHLVITGRFYKNNGNPGNMIMKWNGFDLLSIGGDLLDAFGGYAYNAQVYEAEIINGLIYIGGVFSYAGDIESKRNTVWDGEKFCALGGVSELASSCFTLMNDTIVSGGNWSNDGVELNKLAFYTGSSDLCSTVDVHELERNQSFQIYPNPANEILSIESNHLIQSIQIHTLLGSEVVSTSPQSLSTQIDISHLDTGIYLVHATTNSGSVFTQRLLVE